MKPIIKWQTHTTEATAKVLGVELSVKSNGKGKFESTVYCSGMRPEKDHTFDTLDDGKVWCEQTLQRWINASFEPVSEPLADTLIEKLEQERGYYLQEYQSCLDSHDVVNAIDSCIDIVEAHSQEICNWRNNKGTGLWECHYGGDYTSDCGLEWNMSNKDSPSENEMHFCPKCGKKLVEVQPPSEVQDD